jgi:hypothetical protein
MTSMPDAPCEVTALFPTGAQAGQEAPEDPRTGHVFQTEVATRSARFLRQRYIGRRASGVALRAATMLPIDGMPPRRPVSSV